ncbi:hypothetical protein [Rosenbergiella collisarenosi]|nr:hypothetical protein [Rosenbergiella collisarenosi]
MLVWLEPSVLSHRYPCKLHVHEYATIINALIPVLERQFLT